MIDWKGSYCGPAPDAASWMAQWNFDPVLVALLATMALAASRLPAPRRSAGLVATALLAFAFLSPLCGLTVALFAARAVHHLLLFAVVAPLLAIAWPPRRPPATGTALAIATVLLWSWHLPALYTAALGNIGLYWAMQALLLWSGARYWASLRGAAPLESAAGIAGGAVQMGFLGAVLTFATRPLYAPHLATTAAFGLGPLADQQLAGLIMWVPGMAPYAVAAAWLARRRWRGLSARPTGTVAA
jgi:putative membrane protein